MLDIMEEPDRYESPRKRVKFSPQQTHNTMSWKRIVPRPQTLCDTRRGSFSSSFERSCGNTSMETGEGWIPISTSYTSSVAAPTAEDHGRMEYRHPNQQAIPPARSHNIQPHHRQASVQAADSLLGLRDQACSDQSKLLAISIEDEDYMFLDSGTGASPSSQLSAHQHRYASQPHHNSCMHQIPPTINHPTFCHPHQADSASHTHNHDYYLPQYQPCSLDQCTFDQCSLDPCCFDPDCTLPSECLQHENENCCLFSDCASAASFDLSAIPKTLCSSPDADVCHMQEIAYRCDDDDCKIPRKCTEVDHCEFIPIIDPLLEKRRNAEGARRRGDAGKVQIDLTIQPEVKLEHKCHDKPGYGHLRDHAHVRAPVTRRPKSPRETNEGSKTCLWQTDNGQHQTCGYNCTTADELQEHIVAAHMQDLDGKASLVCRWQGCPSAAGAKPKNTKTKLIRHMVTHSGYRGAPCPHCPKILANAATLAAHLLTHAPSTSKPTFPCPMCESVFAHETSLQTHINSQHKNEKRYSCTYEGCNYATADSSNFSKHKKTHEREKNVAICGICGATVSRKNLGRHRRDLHPETEALSKMT